jgi:uncharacterized protein (TIGR01244 family)
MRIILFLFGFLLIATASFIIWRVAIHNEGTVVPGTLYRSAQLDAKALTREIAANHIRTVINLRGDNTSHPWYDDEIAVCRQLGVTHVDVHWSAQHLPPPDQMEALLRAFHNAPRPILIHCRSGSDRTGLAAGVFLIDQEQVPWKEARKTLSLEYGHVAAYPYFEMNEFIQLYGQSGNPSLEDWTEKDYPIIYSSRSHESKWDKITDPLELMIHGKL